MAKFEITVYNKEVRQKVAEGEHHSRYTDDWADFHYIDINAESEEHARTLAESRYPKSQGFVIDGIQKSPAHKFE